MTANPVMQALMLARADDRLRQLKYEPPRSWTREAKLRFLELPTDMQTYLIARETERDRAVRVSQNEAATCRKQLAAAEARIAELEKLDVLVGNIPSAEPLNETGNQNGNSIEINKTLA
jgi:hypothetical protein